VRGKNRFLAYTGRSGGGEGGGGGGELQRTENNNNEDYFEFFKEKKKTNKILGGRRIESSVLIPPVVRRGRTALTRRCGVLSNGDRLGAPFAAAAGVRSLVGRRMGSRAHAANGGDEAAPVVGFGLDAHGTS
jgi:hypothetical protein